MIKKILVSQPKPSSDKSPYFDIAEKYHVQIDFHPFIKIEGLCAREFRQQRVQVLDHTAVVFNSRHAIDFFFTLCKEMRVAIPEDMKYFALSEAIAHYIQKYVQYRKRKVFYGTTGKWADLVAVMAKHKGETYLVPQSDVHSDEAHLLMEAKKLKHTACAMSRTVSDELESHNPSTYDMLVVFTPAGVESLQSGCPDFKQGDTKLACFGPATQKAAEEAGLRCDLSAPTVEARSMPAAIDLYLSREQG